MKFDTEKIVAGTFYFLFCISLVLNIFYLAGCNDEQADGETRPIEAVTAPILDLTSANIRSDELLRLYTRAGTIARKANLYDTEINAIGQQIQIIAILEMRGYYPVLDIQ